jgi:2-polyprenyl-3-methyl-5-hydroxy-6-metoxy-1,4-benzoquinol methylase
LDLGSGDGWFLEAANREGFDCLGVDVSERLAETARRRSGARVLVGNLHSLNLTPESFDFVNLDLVLMYVAEPRQLLLRIAQLLRPGGICRIREFDVDSIVARLAGQDYWLYGPTRVCSWTRRSIEVLAAATGFRVRHVFPGTEATLSSWIATEINPTLPARVAASVKFVLRKISLGHASLGADVAFYLEKRG